MVRQSPQWLDNKSHYGVNMSLDFDFPTPVNTDGYFDTNSSTVFREDKEFNGNEFSGPTSNKLIFIAESLPSKEPSFS